MAAKKEGNGIKPIPKTIHKQYSKKLKFYQENTQCFLVLKHLLTEGTITGKQAVSKYGIMRLPSRIYDLKCDGINIASRTVVKKNKYGRVTSFAEYYLTKAV